MPTINNRSPRALAAIVLGYVVAQALNSAVVYALYFGAAPPLNLRVAVTVAMCVAGGVLGGLAVRLVAREAAAWAGSRAAMAIALVTLANLAMNKAAEPVWHRVLVLTIMAPLVWYVAKARRSGTVAQ